MVRHLKWFAAPVAVAAILSGCATYDYPYYGYSEPYYGGYGAYSYDYGPYYYGYGYAPYPYYYTPGYYYGGPVFDFRYSDRDRHDHHGRSRDYRGDHDRNRGGDWDRGGRGRPERSSTGPRPTSRAGTTSGTTTRQAVPAAPPRPNVTASRENGPPHAQGGTRLPSRMRDEQRD